MLQGYLVFLLLSITASYQVAADCLPCWRQLQKCVAAEGCSGQEKIRPTVELMTARVLRDCPIQNAGPCPVIGCGKCAPCPPLVTCPTITTSVTTPTAPPTKATSTASTSSTSVTTTATCPNCECSKQELDKCLDSLTFIDLSKGGAQQSRTSWKDESGRLSRLLEREANTSSSYKTKWEEVLKVLQTCQTGYHDANSSLTFAINLVNEHSGRVNACESALAESINRTAVATVDLDKCLNSTSLLVIDHESQISNLTGSFERKLRGCRRLLRNAENQTSEFRQDLTGSPSIISTFPSFCEIFIFLLHRIVGF